MTKFLLSVHVLAAIVAIGPVTVAASMFAPTARQALAAPGDPHPVAVIRMLHRICRVYAALGALVPVFGIATAVSLGVLGQSWLMVALALTAAAAFVLVALVLPAQSGILNEITLVPVVAPDVAGSAVDAVDGSGTTAPRARPGDREAIDGQIRGLAMMTGAFNLLWAVVTVLMIVRPGSTTGA